MQEITIGRKSDNDVVLNDPMVGRCVAKIIRYDDGHYSIVDLMSTNGVYVNGKRIPTGGEVIINNYDVILIGETSLYLEKIILMARLSGIAIDDPAFPPPYNAMCYCPPPEDWDDDKDNKDEKESSWQNALAIIAIVIMLSVVLGSIITSLL